MPTNTPATPEGNDQVGKFRPLAPPQWQPCQYKVKFMHRGLRRGHPSNVFVRQFPNYFPQWQDCLFDFDVDCRDYDWLVVYQDLPKGDSYFVEEILACPRERTMLITGEPSTITVFGTDYLRQYGCILTSQEPWAIRHPNSFYHHPGLMWHYGLPFGQGKIATWDILAGTPPMKKSKNIATVCSERTGKVTLHSSRVHFTWKLKEELPELDVYGKGVNPMSDKAESLDPYRFNIAVENHVYQHHLTEKLPDAFLGYSVPFYHGAPNAADYFPQESFIPIDIRDYKRSKEIIISHLSNNEYEDRLPYVIEARKRVLLEQNLFAIVSRTITQQEKKISTITNGKTIRNRRTMRLVNPLAGLRSLTEKAAIKTYHRLTSRSRNTMRQ